MMDDKRLAEIEALAKEDNYNATRRGLQDIITELLAAYRAQAKRIEELETPKREYLKEAAEAANEEDFKHLFWGQHAEKRSESIKYHNAAIERAKEGKEG